MTFTELIFYKLAALLLIAATFVVTTSHPIRGIIALIVAFLSASGLWMLLESEFLSLVLLFVYVGAVMMLFLFVVMMLNIEKLPQANKRWQVLLLGGMSVAGLFSMLAFILDSTGFGLANVTRFKLRPAGYSHTQVLGKVLYTDYVLSFELAGVILLVAIVAAIALTFRGPRPGTKVQVIKKQLTANKKDRLRLIKMKPEQS